MRLQVGRVGISVYNEASKHPNSFSAAANNPTPRFAANEAPATTYNSQKSHNGKLAQQSHQGAVSCTHGNIRFNGTVFKQGLSNNAQCMQAHASSRNEIWSQPTTKRANIPNSSSAAANNPTPRFAANEES